MISHKPTSVYIDLFEYLGLKEAVEQPHFTHGVEMLSHEKMSAWEMREHELRFQLQTLERLGFLRDIKCYRHQRWRLQLADPVAATIDRFEGLMVEYTELHHRWLGEGTHRKHLPRATVQENVKQYVIERDVVEGVLTEVIWQMGFRVGSPLEMMGTKRERMRYALNALIKEQVLTVERSGNRKEKIWLIKARDKDAIEEDEADAETEVEAEQVMMQSLVEGVNGLTSRLDAQGVDLNGKLTDLTKDVKQSKLDFLELGLKVEALTDVMERLSKAQSGTATILAELKRLADRQPRSWWQSVVKG